MRFAVLPAAGKSTRMGRPKLSLPLGDRTILEHVIAALKQAGVEQVLVVVGPHVPELAALAEKAGAHVCQLAEQTADMRMTVEHGLNWLEERFSPRAEDTWLLVPGDHPALDPVDCATTGGCPSSHYPNCSIFLPTHGGRRGHPTLLTWKHVAAIRTCPAGVGLNTYVRQCVAETWEVHVDSPSHTLGHGHAGRLRAAAARAALTFHLHQVPFHAYPVDRSDGPHGRQSPERAEHLYRPPCALASTGRRYRITPR